MHIGPLLGSSGDLIADRRYRWALDLAARDDLAGAIDILMQTLDLAPAFAAAWFALGAIRDQLGDRDGAIAAFRSARDRDPDDSQGAGLRLARLGDGEAAPAMPGGYVRRLFDQYAARFDAALTGRLGYRAPMILRDAVESVMRLAGRLMRFDALLDLGCGTGLAGMAFRQHAERMTGVDLSPAMIEQARAKQIYDRLAVGDLRAFVAGEAAHSYEIVLAADVFVYVEDLAPILAALVRVLRPGGLLAFTVERHSGCGIILQPTLRYAHGRGHVRGALTAAGFAILCLSETSVRTEKGDPVPGLVVVASTASELAANSGA